jgi:histidine ammonia-lyase
MAASRQVVDQLVSSGETVYGVTTGFGALASERIAPEDAIRLQENLLVSHAVGIGPNHGRHTTRAMLLLRANALARGQSGCRPEIVERLLDFLQLGIHPLVPEQGSVGASGDLAPLAHLALPLIGRGNAEVDGEVVTGAEALERRGLSQIALLPKEGLALLNGTQQMTAIGVLVLLHAERLLSAASVAAAIGSPRAAIASTTTRRAASGTSGIKIGSSRVPASSSTSAGSSISGSSSSKPTSSATR